MRILIIGASGFIARELICALQCQEGTEVIAGIRRPANVLINASANVKERQVEALDISSVADAMQGVSHVVNCVMGKPAAMVKATQNILEVAERLRVSRVIQLSSIAVYGNATGIVGEDHQLTAVDRYGAAKIECEYAIRNFVQRGLDVVTLRPALVYGFGSALWSKRIAQLLRTRRLGDLGEAGDGFCNLIHVRDVARAISTALTYPGISGQAFNLDDPDPPTWNAYLLHFGRALGAYPVTRVPGWQIRFERSFIAPVLRGFELVASLFGRKDIVPVPITPGLVRLFTMNARYNSGCADLLFNGRRIPWQIGVDEIASEIMKRNVINLRRGIG